ncbi:MAG TPA: hypothetical protein VNS58_09375 [Puia sp.]|nr:hypothetical protein [Puia sp.]
MVRDEFQKEENLTPMSGELLKALIDKTMENGKDIRQVSELVRKLPNPTPALENLEQRVEKIENCQDTENELILRHGEKVDDLSKKMSLPIDVIEQLRNAMTEHAALFKKPLKKSVHYTHFLGRSLWVIAGLVAIVIGLIFLWNNTRINANLHADNDIKWRMVKLNSEGRLLQGLQEIESDYLANPDGMKKAVLAEEQRRQQLFEQEQVKNAAADKIEQLETKKKGR